MSRRSVKSDNSGQALIVTSLIITMLLLSTAYYVFEIENNVTDNATLFNYDFLAIKQSTLHTVISALANVSNGGNRSVLKASLDRLASVLKSHSYDRECLLLSTPLNSSPYQDGIEMSWGSSGSGVSSAYVSSLLNVSGLSVNYHSEFETNVTAALTIESSCTGNTGVKSVATTCRVFDEQGSALTREITMFYQNETNGPWIMVTSSNRLNVIDYGNGTYLVSFTAYAQDSLTVSAHVCDLRDIFVMANATYLMR
jgi:hypothetical protein